MSEMTYNVKQDDYKYKSWVFTWNADSKEILIDRFLLESILKCFSTEYIFQEEFVTRRHYQGFFKTEHRMRKHTVLNLFRINGGIIEPRESYENLFDISNLTINHVYGTDKEVISYVTKSESRVGETIYSQNLLPYSTSDLAILENRDRWYLWQSTLAEILFDDKTNVMSRYDKLSKPDDRTIIWIKDAIGCSGKSKFVKYVVNRFKDEVIKLPFGSPSQLRSAVCIAGPKKVYFIDIPRTMAREEDLDAVYSVIEDIKNGFVSTSMYGQFKQLLFDPPHIIIFSNKDCPTAKLSRDRWHEYQIVNNELIKL